MCWYPGFVSNKMLGPDWEVSQSIVRREKGKFSLGQTRFVHGQTQVFSLLYTGETGLVPGTIPVCPWDKPRVGGLQKNCVLNIYVPSSFATLLFHWL